MALLGAVTFVHLGSALVFGLVPALHASRTSLVGALNEAGRGSAADNQSHHWTSVLVVVQLAPTIVLLAGAGLMMRSFLAHYQLETGIETAAVLTMKLDLSERKYPSAEQRAAFYRQLDERLAAMPGARATIASNQPRRGAVTGAFAVEGRETAGDDKRPVVSSVAIGPRYFETLGGRILRGRPFPDADNRFRAGTAVVNERLAAMHFPNENPLGRRIRVETGSATPAGWLTIVGVAGNIRQEDTEDRSFDPIVYVPYGALPVPYASILVRPLSTAGSASLAAMLRELVSAVDADLPLFDVMTLDDSMAIEIWPQRIFGTMFDIFATIALVMAAVGLYAVTANAVARRTREIGVRVALGAGTGHIWRLVIRTASTQVALGLLIGMTGALGVGQVLRGLATQVSHTDPLTLLAVPALLIGVAITATTIPARRAIRLEPVAALRAD